MSVLATAPAIVFGRSPDLSGEVELGELSRLHAEAPLARTTFLSGSLLFLTQDGVLRNDTFVHGQQWPTRLPSTHWHFLL